MADDKSPEELEEQVKSLQLEINDLSTILEAIGQGTQKLTRRLV
jgi:archaellum component FlaC